MSLKWLIAACFSALTWARHSAVVLSHAVGLMLQLPGCQCLQKKFSHRIGLGVALRAERLGCIYIYSILLVGQIYTVTVLLYILQLQKLMDYQVVLQESWKYISRELMGTGRLEELRHLWLGLRERSDDVVFVLEL